MYLITTKNIFSTKIIMDDLRKKTPEECITLLGPKFIQLDWYDFSDQILKEHATKVVYKRVIGKSTRYYNVIL